MGSIDNESMRYILDHITRQCAEIKLDMRTESSLIRHLLDKETMRQEEAIQALKEEIDKRLALMDERILDLQEYKWKSVGAVALAAILIEVVIAWIR